MILGVYAAAQGIAIRVKVVSPAVGLFCRKPDGALLGNIIRPVGHIDSTKAFDVLFIL